MPPFDPVSIASPPRDPAPAGDGVPASGVAVPARWVLVAVWGLVALAHGALPPERRVANWPLGYLLMEGLAAFSLGWRAGASRGAYRRAWTLLALSVGLEVPNLLLLYLGMHGVLGAWADVTSSLFSLLTGLLVLLGVLAFPKGPETLGLFWRRVLDALIFAVSVLFLLWALGVEGALRTAGSRMDLRVLAAYVNAALLGGGVLFAISYHPPRIRGPLGWLAASVVAWLAGLSWWAVLHLGTTQSHGAWLAVVAAIPLFQGLAAWSPRSVDLPEDPAHAIGLRTLRMLPYLPVGLAVVLISALLPHAAPDVVRGAMAILLGIVVLLLFRQYLAIRDLDASRRTLEARVLERTRALEQAQDTLLRAERMNTTALMGAGLAHDLNNLLTAMRASAELASLGLAEGRAPTREDLDRISATADRAAGLTRQIMGFARQEGEEIAPIDLCAILADVEPTLRLLLSRSVTLLTSVEADGVLAVRSSRARLEQMLVNLVSNAVDAMPEGGRLDIRAGRDSREPGWVLLEVADTGCGMPPEVQARIFEPFFTTKPPGKGTGLGLPSLKALVEEGGGRLEVASRTGVGTRFRILLPEFCESNSPHS